MKAAAELTSSPTIDRDVLTLQAEVDARNEKLKAEMLGVYEVSPVSATTCTACDVRSLWAFVQCRQTQGPWKHCARQVWIVAGQFPDAEGSCHWQLQRELHKQPGTVMTSLRGGMLDRQTDRQTARLTDRQTDRRTKQMIDEVQCVAVCERCDPCLSRSVLRCEKKHRLTHGCCRHFSRMRLFPHTVLKGRTQTDRA